MPDSSHPPTHREHGNRLTQSLPKTLRSFISHELRAPLTCVDGALRLISSTEVKLADEQVSELISVASNSARRLVLLVDKLLDDSELPGLANLPMAANTLTPSSRSLPSGESDDARELNILMIEDDDDYFRFIRQVLQSVSSAKFALKHCDSIAAITDALRAEPIDVILLDLLLPDAQGLAAVRAVRGMFPRLPIIVLTGVDDEHLGLQAVAEGADDFLVKHHINNDSLVRGIRYAVTRKKFEESTMRLAAIKDFTNALAHDLMAPLSGTRNVLHALASRSCGPLNPVQEEIVHTLSRSNQRQLALVEKLLEVYHYDLMPTRTQFEFLSVGEILNEATQELSEDAAALIAIDLPWQQDPPRLKGDREALVRLFFNLLENACLYGDQTRGIRVNCEVQEGTILVNVHNWGPLVPKEVIAGMSDRFWRGIPGKTYVVKSGVGLYLAQRIAALHGGKIVCKSEKRNGTTMTVQLPLSAKR